jgi:uncharacterized protein YjbI with pentapeptide repeats
MANADHFALLQQGTAIWNHWRTRNPGTLSDLSEANLSEANLSEANLREADLFQADLSKANLSIANLSKANLTESNLSMADLSGAKLIGALLHGTNLRGANLCVADLVGASLVGANLVGAWLVDANLMNASLFAANLAGALLMKADLVGTVFVGVDIRHAHLTGCSVYGISAWDVILDDETKQEDLIITPHGEPIITVDNIKVAQFIYLLLNNKEIRDVIDTITSKAVLILGRFSPERKMILDRLREGLRTRHYAPIMFDFEKPKSRNTVETIRTLAGMSKFIIADLTDAKYVVQELQAIVPDFPSVPVRFINEKIPKRARNVRPYKTFSMGPKRRFRIQERQRSNRIHRQQNSQTYRGKVKKAFLITAYQFDKS